MIDLIPDDFKIFCHQTGIDLFELQGDKTVMFEPHGQCWRCSDWFHFKALHTVPGKSTPKWPIRYKGYTCKKCHREFMAGRR